MIMIMTKYLDTFKPPVVAPSLAVASVQDFMELVR